MRLERSVFLCQVPSEAHETVGWITRGHVTECDSLEIGGGQVLAATVSVRGLVTTRTCSAC